MLKSRICSTLLLITTVITFCIFLHFYFSPPGDWMRHFTPLIIRAYGVDNNLFMRISSTQPLSRSTSPWINASGLTMLPLQGRTPRPNDTVRYVSMCPENFDSRRLGNQLFNFAAMLHVAGLTGRRVAMIRRHPDGWIDRWFNVSVTRFDDVNKTLCPCTTVGEKIGLAYSEDVKLLRNRSDIVGKSLLICGWFQSWKYTTGGVESLLRSQLRFLPSVLADVRSYVDHIRPRGWNVQSYSRIGIHVRAGDVMGKHQFELGYAIPQRPYYERAMTWFLSKHESRVQFIVMSDNLDWLKEAINFTSIIEQLNVTIVNYEVNVTHSEGHNPGFDLALMSLCDGVIVSTGTFGWWGAWLSNKTTVYFSKWPRPGSFLSSIYKREDYFPPSWIPMDGPEFPCCLP